MKAIMCLIIMSLPLFCFTQTADEWLRQKRTQKKYLLEQIAALQVYLDYAQKGYKIADDGINAIKRIKNGDFTLHQDFFRSLSLVNPDLKKWVDFGKLVSLQIQFVISSKNTIQFAMESDKFLGTELVYFRKVFERIMDDCLSLLEELFQLVTDNESEMNDASRLIRMEKLLTDMLNCYAANYSFSQDVRLLTLQRIREQSEIDFSKTINGVR